MSARNDIYLNALCLAAYAPGEPSLKIAQAVVNMYDRMTETEKTTLPQVSSFYIKLLREVAESRLDLSNRAEASSVLLTYQDDPIFASGKRDFNELQNTLMPDVVPSPSKIRTLFNRVKHAIIFYKTSQRIRRMMLDNQHAQREDDVEKQTALLKDLLAAAESLRSEIESDPSGETDVDTPVDEIDMSDPNSVLRALRQQKKKRSGAGIRFGLQGLNRMFGPSRSAAYGEVMAVAARSHNGKSEVLMAMARAHATLNDPPDTGGKLPIILFISLENEIYENLMAWFKSMYANTYHKLPDGLKDEEIVEYTMKAFSSRGFRFLVYRRMGENFGYREYVELVEGLESKLQGKVVATYLDYITLCHRCPEDKEYNEPGQIQRMLRRFKDFAQHREMFFCTGLQMDSEASRLASSGITNIVKRYGEAHLSDCKSARKELDILFFLEIENNHIGVPYLTIAWNKHKYVHDTPQEDKYTAYAFVDKLGLLDDVAGPDRSVKDIYATQETAEEQQPVDVFK